MVDHGWPGCEESCIDEEAVAHAKKNQLTEQEVVKLAETFKVLGDPTRIRIIQALRQGELCVYDLSLVLEMSQSAISHQLRVLRNLRLVKFRKEGKVVYYSLDDDHITQLFDQGLDHVRHT
ncbi:MAG: winged helix-turn-helix transcriptional regulator [Clostridia bacterium]|jgi:DNA-binding transcriptional ArsR family regulator|nr:winged helix-turn-helix transcriptional regulator [Clostridia bacterium]